MGEALGALTLSGGLRARLRVVAAAANPWQQAIVELQRQRHQMRTLIERQAVLVVNLDPA
jgi:hypothetical protein